MIILIMRFLPIIIERQLKNKLYTDEIAMIIKSLIGMIFFIMAYSPKRIGASYVTLI
jgi:hypothetical protein